jgi:uncharacterized membrane protein HdeD (DUF308 family)
MMKLKKGISWIGVSFLKHLDDLFLLLGMCLLIFGIHLISTPAAFIAAGVLLMGFSFLLARR